MRLRLAVINLVVLICSLACFYVSLTARNEDLWIGIGCGFLVLGFIFFLIGVALARSDRQLPSSSHSL